MVARPLVLAPALLCCCLAATFSRSHAHAEQPEFRRLWPAGAPAAKADTSADQPGLWIYPATPQPNQQPSRTAVVICPGGGYGIHAVDHEGTQPARFFNRLGITAFVLRYRLAPYRHPVPLNDALRAIRFVRSHAEEFQIDPDRVGIMGFSAGGHLASTALTLFTPPDAAAADPIDRLSSRPSFGILGYPVISFSAEFAHRGSARNLLGPDASADQLAALSSDRNVTKDTPPTFLFHTAEDSGVPPENSIAFFTACKRAGVPAELHVFQQGQHGVGLAPGHPALQSWLDTATTWLRQNALLAHGTRRAVTGTVQLNGTPLRWGSIALRPRNPHQPTAWAMISGGKFSVPQHSGPLAGEYDVVVTDMGAVQPGPTIDDARILNSPHQITIGDADASLELSYSDK
ncbi:MAG: alpha/beta hydrolase [Planctomycetaceae bacterium]